VRGPRGGRGASAPGVGAAVAGRILAPAINEVGQGWQLGQHGEVGTRLRHIGEERLTGRGLSAVVAAQ
jgi:hypothetical protein